MANANKQVIANRLSKGSVVPHRYELGNDFPQLLPSELGIGRKLKLQFLAGLAEGSLLQDQLAAPEKKKRGAIICVVDETGSMAQNSRIMWAKAISTTMFMVCEKEGRQFTYIPFGMGLGEQRIDLNDMFMKFANYGGTNIGMAIEGLTKFPDDYYRDADIVLISDGDSPVVSDPIAKKFKAKKRATGARLFSIIIDGSKQLVENVSDQAIALPINPTKDFGQTIEILEWMSS